MGKRNVTDLTNVKCEECNHHNSNCLLCRRCWLLCTSSGEVERQEHMKT